MSDKKQLNEGCFFKGVTVPGSIVVGMAWWQKIKAIECDMQEQRGEC